MIVHHEEGHKSVVSRSWLTRVVALLPPFYWLIIHTQVTHQALSGDDHGLAEDLLVPQEGRPDVGPDGESV